MAAPAVLGIALDVFVVALVLELEDNVVAIADDVRTISAAGKVTVAFRWICRPLGENIKSWIITSPI